MNIFEEIAKKAEAIGKDIKRWKADKRAKQLEELSQEIYKLHGEISTAAKEREKMGEDIAASVKELEKFVSDSWKLFDKPETAIKMTDDIKKDLQAYVKKVKDNDAIVDEWSKKHDKYDKLKAKYEAET